MGRASNAMGFLSRLRKDVRGNTLAMMAAMLIPLLGFSGAAIDMARLYVIKVRLQQACDAGVLAGRKAMTDTSTKGSLDSAAAAQAQTFFANNFRSGWFKNANPVFTPTKASVGTTAVANGVNGTATVTVPMAVMSLFGVKPTSLTVTCQAVYDLADTDVMFVLDTTGSMSATPTGSNGSKTAYTRDDGIQAYYTKEQNGSKIEALRQAVILFDKTMTENKQSDTVVRYGFAPYSTVVNVGKLLPAMDKGATTFNYNTRTVDGDYDYVTSVTTVYGMTQADCLTAKRTPGWTTGFQYKKSSGSAVTISGYYAYANFTGATSWSSSNSGTCTGTATIKRPMWKFAPAAIDVADYLKLGWVPTPGRLDGSTSKWRGCVELTGDSTASSFSSDSLPADLDPDQLPAWRPMWPEAVWYPQDRNNDVKDESVNEKYSYKALGTYEGNDSVTCPMEAQTLAKMTADQVNSYVYATNFKAAGNTYHDYGMSWGLRMLSTKGPFSASVAPPDGRKQPAQNIVFMTDGAPVADLDNYQMYGIEGVDGNLANGNTTQEAKNHSARFRVLCDAAKARGITVYMIAFGTSLTADMKYCASPGQSFTAKDNDALQDAFSSIAKRIAMLRVSQ